MNKTSLKRSILRAIIEIAFIVFLFYSNLLMGEYNKSGNGQKKNILYALNDILTLDNFLIAVTAAIIGFIVFEFLRKKL